MGRGPGEWSRGDRDRAASGGLARGRQCSRGRRDEAAEGGSTYLHCALYYCCNLCVPGKAKLLVSRQSDGAGGRGKIQYRSYINILIAVATFYGFVAVCFLLGVSVQMIRLGGLCRITAGARGVGVAVWFLLGVSVQMI